MSNVASLEKTLGKDLVSKILTSKILLIGSGGIGCELLKNLALSGFYDVQVIDLDTIDISNLNRQLLFRTQHVGMPKCQVACEVAASMVTQSNGGNINVQYVPHHGNICDNSKFNVQYVSQFDIVLNALDNVTARRRVNRLCLAANVPLIEAGTTGYLGQVTVIHKPSNLACYECKTQETQKVYPICTIRSTPSLPVHTIVWAKELYKLLFGDKIQESMLFEDTTTDEPSSYMDCVQKFRDFISQKENSITNKDDLLNLVKDLWIALYDLEIKKQLEMGRYKAAKKTPVPLDKNLITQAVSSTPAPSSLESSKSTDIWSQQQCLAECTQCLVNADISTVLPSFDKDDDMAMRFVTATSNLRNSIFGITPMQSLYSAKGIAGNIIPAIATTNAIAAGLQILQMYHILEAKIKAKDEAELSLSDACSYVNCIRNKTRNGMYLTASKLEQPNPNCFVCRNATIPLSLDTRHWTLEKLLSIIIKDRLGFNEPTIMLSDDIIWEEGDDADTTYQQNLPKTLHNLPCGGVSHGTILSLEDFSQDLTVNICITHQEEWDTKLDLHQQFVVGGAALKASESDSTAAKSNKEATGSAAPPVAAAKSANDNVGYDNDDDDVVVVLEDEGEQNSKKDDPLKRKGDDGSDDNGQPKKKRKVDGEMEIIEID